MNALLIIPVGYPTNNTVLNLNIFFAQKLGHQRCVVNFYTLSGARINRETFYTQTIQGYSYRSKQYKSRVTVIGKNTINSMIICS